MRQVNVGRLSVAKEFFRDAHNNANNKYGKILPYEFHLNIALLVAEEFVEILPDDIELVTDVFIAVYGHDVMEETNLSYNDVKKTVGVRAADLIYAVTNEKGKTRKERASANYYTGIRNEPYAIFVKLCDRIANVRFGKLTKSDMVSMYRKENSDFLRSLWISPGVIPEHTDWSQNYAPMTLHLVSLFETE